MRLLSFIVLAAAFVASCNADEGAGAQGSRSAADGPFVATPVAQFSEPWAMTFLPDGRLLVTEKKGSLKLMDRNGNIGTIGGTPEVDYGGQGGFGDVALHPGFATNGIIYLSWAEPGSGGSRGAVVGRGRLQLDQQGGGRIEDLKVVWRQNPKMSGRGHYSHRILFASDGHMFITSGERQEFTPAQDMNMNLGKVIRLTDSGAVPPDNPFAGKGPVASQVWSLGHRNMLGAAFDAGGQLWVAEMGPDGGDEFNLVERGSNYGYPIVSNGDHYDGRTIPDHDTRPEFNAPEITWTPVISPGGMIIYSGDMFLQWRGSALIGGLSSEALIRVAIDGKTAREAERWDMDARIREVEQGPDGAVWLLEDERGGSGGRLLKLTPRR